MIAKMYEDLLITTLDKLADEMRNETAAQIATAEQAEKAGDITTLLQAQGQVKALAKAISLIEREKAELSQK
jgi:hypothetical protein